MEVLDPGHKYLLQSFDGGSPIELTFVKRNDPPEKYPGNVDAYPGTQSQEVFRALIERSLYVDNQDPCIENKKVTAMLRRCLKLLENRHLRRHRLHSGKWPTSPPETLPICGRCGHIVCFCEQL